MSYLIIALVIVFAVSAYRQLTLEERAVVLKTTANGIKATATYAAKGAKEVVLSTYDLGATAGMQVSLEQQDSLNAFDKWNKEMAAEGGAQKVAIRTAKAHGEASGLTDISNGIKTRREEVAALLAEARALRVKQ